jgi:hypothetical protein
MTRLAEHDRAMSYAHLWKIKNAPAAMKAKPKA